MRKILVALDGSESAFRALAYAISLAEGRDDEIHVVCVEEIGHHAGAVLPMHNEKEWSQSHYAPAIRRGQEMGQAAGVAISPHVIIGHETKAIVEFIELARFDLLVLGFHGLTAYGAHVMGGTCFALAQHAPCPVLIVK